MFQFPSSQERIPMAAPTVYANSSAPTTVEKLRGLPWSMAGNAANVVFVKLTFFGSVFVLFLNTLGLNKTQTGFLLSLIPYFGLVALFAAPFVARHGLKRSYLTFWGLRQVATFAMLFTPWISMQFGFQAMFVYVTVVMIWFALCRSLGETAGMPWRQEYIPNNIRGKYSAKDSMITTIAGFGAVMVSGFVVGRAAGINGYLLLFLIGGSFGLLGVWFYSHIPGGAPVEKGEAERSVWAGMLDSLKDRNFLRFLFGIAFIILATGPLNAFLPLFMQEEAGIEPGNVILLQMGVLFGSLVSSYLWGWSSDRYGSKPAMMFSVFWRVLLPVIYMFTPRGVALSLPYAMFASMIQGVVDVGWTIGSARMLYVGVVPTAKKSEYMALHYAWIGVIGGTSQLLGGRLLDASSSLTGQIGGISIDAYTPLFLLSVVMAAISVFFFTRVRADAEYGVGEFAGMFLRGNPFLAVSSLVRYQFAKDETAAVLVTERLGSAKSPLAVDELLEALKDPRFNVRFEAIVAMARTKPDPRVVEALVETLNGTEVALSALSAWALGRLGDTAAVPALHAALDKPYQSIQVQAIRALGALNDEQALPMLLDGFRQEEDKGLLMAYASSMGKLGAVEAVPELLQLLHEFENEGARLELALALARLVGAEHYFIQLVRQVRADPGTAIAVAVSNLRKELPTGPTSMLLGDAIANLPETLFTPTAWLILQECGRCLRESGDEHIEYVLLALHVMHAGYSETDQSV
jgi:MFS family permease